MTSTELENRINKLNERIAKIQKRLDKWTTNYSSEKVFIKEYGWLNNFEDRKEDYLNSWKDRCNDEVHYAQRDLEDANATLTKYKNMLLITQEKENRPVIQIFKDFFEKWKREIKAYAEPLYKRYLELDRQLCDHHNKKYMLLQTMTEEEYKEKYKQLRDAEKVLLSDSWVNKMYDCKHYGNKTFDEFLDKYMLDRYYELVNKITKVTGEITDVSRLYVGHDGSLNGEIIGETGKARIETIIAGGYNENIIVNVKHGQCAHYRVLVHEIKSKNFK